MIIQMLDFFLQRSCPLSTMVHQHPIGIPSSTNCAPLLKIVERGKIVNYFHEFPASEMMQSCRTIIYNRQQYTFSKCLPAYP